MNEMENASFVNSAYKNATTCNNIPNSTDENSTLVIPTAGLVSIYSLVLIIGIIGNAITCTVIARIKSMHTPTNYYLFSLAISDMIFLVVRAGYRLYVLLWEPPRKSIWVNFPLLLIAEATTNTTVLTTTAFTVERYLAICHPFFKRWAVSKLSGVVKYIVGIWILSFLLAIPPSWYISNKVVYGSPFRHHIYVVVSSVVIFYVIPLVLITVLYILIGCALRKYKNDKTLTVNVSSHDRRVIKILVTIVIVFFICWTPYWTLRILSTYNIRVSNSKAHKNNLWMYMLWISLLSTIVNPLIYSVMSSKFRKAFLSVFAKLWCVTCLQKFVPQRNHPEDSIRTTSIEFDLSMGSRASIENRSQN